MHPVLPEPELCSTACAGNGGAEPLPRLSSAPRSRANPVFNHNRSAVKEETLWEHRRRSMASASVWPGRKVMRIYQLLCPLFSHHGFLLFILLPTWFHFINKYKVMHFPGLHSLMTSRCTESETQRRSHGAQGPPGPGFGLSNLIRLRSLVLQPGDLPFSHGRSPGICFSHRVKTLAPYP